MLMAAFIPELKETGMTGGIRDTNRQCWEHQLTIPGRQGMIQEWNRLLETIFNSDATSLVGILARRSMLP